MASEKIGQLTNGGALQASDAIPIARTGSNYKILGSAFLTPSGNGSLLTNLNASNIASGTLNTARLPTEISATNIADGSVSNTEFQYLNGASSNIQGQINDILNNIITWNIITSSTQSITINNGYIARSATSVDFTLPTAATIGQKFIILYRSPSAGQLLQNAGQTIIAGDQQTTVGVSGKIQNINNGEVLEIICTNTDTEFMVINFMGNATAV